MSMLETVAVYVGIPAAVYGVIAALVYLSAARTSGRRYRPGRPYEFTPVWFVSAAAGRSPAPAPGTALEAAPAASDAEDVSVPGPPAPGATGPKGGARGSW